MNLILVLACFLLALPSLQAEQPALPAGVSDTQRPGDRPLPPLEALKKMTVPEDFQVTLFAGEPDALQPIAFEFDDRGRLWVVECFSYPEWKTLVSCKHCFPSLFLPRCKSGRRLACYSIWRSIILRRLRLKASFLH